MITSTRGLFTRRTWNVDPSRSRVGFAIRHLGVATVRGRFHSFAGRIADTGDGLRIDGDVHAASIDTGDGIRDGRLRAELFDVERFPTIELGARCPAPAAAEEGLLAGTLAIRDVLRPVVLRATAEPLDDDTVRVVLEGDISRSEFGLDWSALRRAGRLFVGDRVRLHADVVLTRDSANGELR